MVDWPGEDSLHSKLPSLLVVPEHVSHPLQIGAFSECSIISPVTLAVSSKDSQCKPERVLGTRSKNDDDNAAHAIRLLQALGYDVKNEADLDRLRPSDEYEQELIVAAEVRAYFQVAYKVSSTICL